MNSEKSQTDFVGKKATGRMSEPVRIRGVRNTLQKYFTPSINTHKGTISFWCVLLILSWFIYMKYFLILSFQVLGIVQF